MQHCYLGGSVMTFRNCLVGLVILGVVPAACGDSSSDGDGGNEAGADNAGEGGTSGSSPTGGSSTGGRGGSSGSSTGGRGGTSTGGTAGDGGEPTGGTGAEGGSDDGGMGGEPGTGGSSAGVGGMGGSGVAGGGTTGAGTGGAGGAGMGGTGGKAGGGGTGGKAGGGGGGNGAVETACSDGQDNDGDTAADCADSDCALVCSLGTCPAGTSPAVYTATGLPVAIPDNMAASPAFAPITITTAGLVGRIAVQTSITHTYASDLELSLVTPYGVRQLAADFGAGGDNYTRTVFVDGAATAISAGTVPFTGTFSPMQELGVVNGVTLAGTYGLRAGDDAAMDTGQVTSFSLAFCQCLAASGSCEFGPYACENGVDDDGDGLVDCQETACSSSPSCPRVEHACGDGLDNDANAMIDCADPACSWACTALGSSCTGANRLFTYGTRNVPQSIGAVAGAFPAPIFASARGTIVSSALRFNATHIFDQDITLFVTSPSGTIRNITSGNGSSGDNYVNTVFIDSAATAVSAGVAPFTGNYRPEEPLSAWASQPAAGYWFGDLRDTAAMDGGTFTELSLGLCVTP
ncbi:MAG TPA: proprotein convertase P-domain-containing protein [Polyangiaceae bacterium]